MRRTIRTPFRAGVLGALGAVGALALGAGSAQAAACANPPAGSLGVEFVVDMSTSMTQNDPNNLRFDAVRLGLGLLDNGDTVGVERFAGTNPPAPNNGDASAVLPPTVLTSTNRQALADQAINNIGQLGPETDYQAAFNVAAQQLAQVCAARKAVVFLSDGQPTVGNESPTVAQVAGAPVYTIALLTDPDHIMERIAQLTQGQFYLASTADSLQQGFINAVSAARGISTPVGSVTINVKPGQTIDTPVQVPPGAAQLQASATWALGGFTVGLVTPSGQVIDGSTPVAGVTPDLGGTFSRFTVTSPAAGRWLVRVTGASTNPAQGTNVVVSAAVTLAGVPTQAPAIVPPVLPRRVTYLRANVRHLTRGRGIVVRFGLNSAAVTRITFARRGVKTGARSRIIGASVGRNTVRLPASWFPLRLARGTYVITVAPKGAKAAHLRLPLGPHRVIGLRVEANRLTRGIGNVVTFRLEVAARGRAILARTAHGRALASVAIRGRAGRNRLVLPATFPPASVAAGRYWLVIAPTGATPAEHAVTVR